MSASKKKNPDTKIKEIELSKIKPYEDNPRMITEEAIHKVADSIRCYGFKQPIVVDKYYFIIAGHTRYEASKALNLKKAPVIVAEDLSDEKAKAYRLADNKLHLTTWDDDKLTKEINALLDIDYDMELTGFSQKEIDEIIEKSQQPVEYTEEDPHDEKYDNEPVKVEKGDLWILGNHRILCGDPTNPNDTVKLFEDDSPPLLITHIDLKEQAPIKDVLSLFEGDIFYVWLQKNEIKQSLQAIEDCNFELQSLIVLEKDYPEPQENNYSKAHELCIYAKRKNSNTYWVANKQDTDLWKIIENEKDLHLRVLRNHKIKQVYNPLLKNPSIVMACEQREKNCYAITSKPKTLDAVIKTWEKKTGKEAVRTSG